MWFADRLEHNRSQLQAFTFLIGIKRNSKWWIIIITTFIITNNLFLINAGIENTLIQKFLIGSIL